MSAPTRGNAVATASIAATDRRNQFGGDPAAAIQATSTTAFLTFDGGPDMPQVIALGRGVYRTLTSVPLPCEAPLSRTQPRELPIECGNGLRRGLLLGQHWQHDQHRFSLRRRQPGPAISSMRATTACADAT